MNLKLGEKIYELNLYQDNLSTDYKGTNLPLLLGGSLKNGGSVSLTINDNFIYGFIKQGASDIYIEPLHYLVKGAEKNLYIVYNLSLIHI